MAMSSEQLISIISQAFEYKRFPDAPDIDKSSDVWEETEFFWGKPWGQVDLEAFNTYPSVLACAPDEFFPIFCGRMLLLCVQTEEYELEAFDRYVGIWFDAPLKPELDKNRLRGDLSQKIASSLTSQQIAAIKAFVDFRTGVLHPIDNDPAIRFIRTIENY